MIWPPRRRGADTGRPSRRALARWGFIVAAGLVTAAPALAGDVDFMATLVARSFFQGLLTGQPSAIFPLCGKQVSFDGEIIKKPGALKKKLRELNSRARRRGLKLEKLLVIPYREAVRRYGPPPARLRGSVGRGKVVALARFNHLGAVAILQRRGPFWKVIAITD